MTTGPWVSHVERHVVLSRGLTCLVAPSGECTVDLLDLAPSLRLSDLDASLGLRAVALDFDPDSPESKMACYLKDGELYSIGCQADDLGMRALYEFECGDDVERMSEEIRYYLRAATYHFEAVAGRYSALRKMGGGSWLADPIGPPLGTSDSRLFPYAPTESCGRWSGSGSARLCEYDAAAVFVNLRSAFDEMAQLIVYAFPHPQLPTRMKRLVEGFIAGRCGSVAPDVVEATISMWGRVGGRIRSYRDHVIHVGPLTGNGGEPVYRVCRLGDRAIGVSLLLPDNPASTALPSLHAWSPEYSHLTDLLDFIHSELTSASVEINQLHEVVMQAGYPQASITGGSATPG